MLRDMVFRFKRGRLLTRPWWALHREGQLAVVDAAFQTLEAQFADPDMVSTVHHGDPGSLLVVWGESYTAQHVVDQLVDCRAAVVDVFSLVFAQVCQEMIHSLQSTLRKGMLE